jgi:RNA polymerase sigma factor (sigma-70 family)
MRGAGDDPWEGEYERHRVVVLRMLARRFPRLDEDERLAIYHDAWLRAYSKRERGEQIVSLRAYLLATTGAEALHMLSRGKVPMPIGPDDARLASIADGAPPVDEQVVMRDQVRIARSLLDALDERQRDVLKLRWDLQLTGEEVRSALGLTTRQYRRLAEEGAAALVDRLEELENGQWSRRMRSLLTACLVEVGDDDGERRRGFASRRQRAAAQRLIDSDPHAAALYAELRRSGRRATALLPLPVAAFEREPSELLARVLEGLSAVRDGAAHGVEAVRQQATSVYLRVADPTLLVAGPRPGAAAAVAVGALALGGGAYATNHLVAPVERPSPAPLHSSASAFPRAVATASAASSRSRPPTRTHRSPRPRPRATPAPQPPTPSTSPPTQPPSAPPTPTQPPQPTEFGFED